MAEHTFENGIENCVDGDQRINRPFGVSGNFCQFSAGRNDIGCPYLNKDSCIVARNTSAQDESKPLEYFGCSYQRKTEN